MRFSIVCLFLLFEACLSQKVILMSFDGFRHDYIEEAARAGKRVDAFNKITDMGFRGMEVQSVMVSLTFPSHYSLTTGRNVENHGLVGNTFWDPNLKDMYKYTDDLKNLQPQWFTQNKNEPIWLTNQRKGGKSGVFYWPGSDSRMYGEMEYVNFGLYNGKPNLTYRIERVMDWITQPDVNFVAMYYNQPDSNGHSYGPLSPQVFNSVEEINDGLNYLLTRINSADFSVPPNIIITSDHGMTGVNYTKVVNVSSVLDPSEYNFGVDSSPATLGIWPKDNGLTVEQLYEKVKNLPNCDVYLKESIPDKYHYKNNSRIAPIVIIAHSGWMILTNASNPYTKTLNGMHGYDNFGVDMHPFIIAAGPNIRQLGKVPIFYQVDVYPLVCLLLRIYEPNVIDGDVFRVTQFVKELPLISVLKQFERYAKGLDPLPDSASVLGGHVVLIFVITMVVQHILRR